MFKGSGLNDKWILEGEERIVVTGNVGAGRYIFGLPWLLFGLYFLYRYLILGIVEYIQAGDIIGIFTGVLGWLAIILIFGGIFVVPGWAFVFLRRKVVIDALHREVDEKNDFLIFSRGKTHLLTNFDHILLVESYSRSKDGPGTTMYNVKLMAKEAPDYVLVGMMQDEDEAERLGQAVSDLVGLPFSVQEEVERS